MPLAESLKHVTLFSGLDAKAREAIARLAVERKAAAGQMIIRDGRPADGFYVV
ncbi:MAG: Crp/Fnr family transcriptional regulator, partial [Planctomycetes bacterium]|nr:Crp/Fnr family transcriptional regulator [Planctomycetota bacterium]